MSTTAAVAAGSIKATEYEITEFIRINMDETNVVYMPMDQRREVDPQKQSVAAAPGVRRASTCPNGLIGGFDKSERTVYDLFNNAVKKYGKAPLMGFRKPAPADAPAGTEAGPFEWMTYDDVGLRVKQVAAGLRKLGITPGAHVGIYAKNRPEWQFAGEACHTQSMVSVALYDSLGEDSGLYIVNHAELQAIFCSAETLKKTLGISPQAQYLKYVVCFDAVKADDKDKLQQTTGGKVQLLTLQELEQLGKENPCEDVPPSPDNLSTIMYTSGTTGTPKGVMISHRSFVASIAGLANAVPTLVKDDSFLSYLPLAHIFERVAELMFMVLGGRFGYWQGDVKLLRSDIQALQPTVLIGVPRIFDRFYDAIKQKATNPNESSWLKRYLFTKAFEAKRYTRAHGGTTPIWDALVFKKLKVVLGGRCKVMISGSAPLRPEVQEFLSIAFDCPFIQGYGSTETCAASTAQPSREHHCGRAGAPVPSVEIKLEDVPELNYLSKNDQGEICIRGPTVAYGYYKELDKTREVFDDQGFYHTGDIGQWTKEGSLVIIDRKKNIFKLAQGEYIAVENIESKLVTPYGTKTWVYGNSFKSFLVAFVAVNPDTFVNLAKEQGFADASKDNLEKLCQEQKLRDAVLQSMLDAAKPHLKGFELPKKVTLLPKQFEEYPDCMTPSMKLVRNELAKVFDQNIKQMYVEGGEP